MNKNLPCKTTNEDMAYTLITEPITLPTDIYSRDGNFGSIQDLSIEEGKTINIRNYPETQLIQNKILGFTPIVTGYVFLKTFHNNQFINEFKCAFIDQKEYDITEILKKVMKFQKLNPYEKIYLLKRLYGMQIINYGHSYIMLKFGLRPRRLTSSDINQLNFISILRQTLFFIIFKTPHRDIKSENILNDGDNLILIDFDNIILQSYNGISQVNSRYYNPRNLELSRNNKKDIDIIICKEIFQQEYRSRELIITLFKSIHSLIKMLNGEDFYYEININEIYYKSESRQLDDDDKGIG
jgi:serine/threonine protein kinase